MNCLQDKDYIMKKAEAITIRILDKEYHLICPEDKRSELQEAADYLDRMMREIRSSGKAIGVERIAVTAALNITYEMLSQKSKKKDTQQSLL